MRTSLTGCLPLWFAPLGAFTDLISMLAACGIFIPVLLSLQNVDFRLKLDAEAAENRLLNNLHEV